MGQIPWKKLAAYCGVFFALVILRAVVSLGRTWYWESWQRGSDPAGFRKLMVESVTHDPCVYGGLCAGILAIGCLVLYALSHRKDTVPEAEG